MVGLNGRRLLDGHDKQLAGTLQDLPERALMVLGEVHHYHERHA